MSRRRELYEMAWPEYVCRCGCTRLEIDTRLADLYADLVMLFPACGWHAGILLTSGFRCRSHNTDVGGAPDSRHLYGLALDVMVPGLPAVELYRGINELKAAREACIGVYPDQGFCHVDLRPYRHRFAVVGPRENSRYTDIRKVIPDAK